MADGLQIDLENWMAELPESLQDSPLIYLAIPGFGFNKIFQLIHVLFMIVNWVIILGSHDSMTFGINRSSTLAPDAPPAARHLWPVFKGTTIRWSKTQNADVQEQLYSGIRSGKILKINLYN